MDKSKLSDKELWSQFHAGDDEILTIIYKKYVHDMYDYGLKMTCDKELVQDCIQEIFIHLIRQKKQLLILTNMRYYLYKSLRNKIVEEWRLEKRKLKLDQTLGYEKETVLTDVESEIIQAEETIRIKRELIVAMKNLTQKQAEIISLRFTQDLSYDQIAILLNIDIASARTLVYRTLKSIKKSLEL